MTVTVIISNGDETIISNDKPRITCADDTMKKRKFPLNCKWYVIIGIAVVSLIAAITALVIVRDNQVKDWESQSNNYCMTSECRGLANSMMSSMNRSVSPCEDFYEYSCGNWKVNNPNQLWKMTALAEKNMAILIEIINRPRSWFNTSVELKVKDYYTSCVDDNRLINQAGAQPLIDLINSLNWGVNISRWNRNWVLPDDWDLTKQMSDLQKFNPDSFVAVYVSKNTENTSQNVVTIGPGVFHLPTKDYYLDNSTQGMKILSTYLDYMISVLQVLGAPNQTYTRESMLDVLQFKVKLANITSSSYLVTNLSTIIEKCNQINWLYLVNKLLSDTNVTVSVSETVRIINIDYLVKLNDILAVYNSTYNGRKTLFNYLLWRMIYAFVNDLSDEIRSLQNPLKLLLSGGSLAKRTSKTCVSDTDTVLGYALGAIYVRENFPGKSKSVAKNMIENLRSAFADNLYTLEWLDPVTRGYALDKVNSLTSFIGYPDYILNADQLEQHYDKFPVNESTYFKNRVQYQKFVFIANINTLRETPKLAWKMTPPTVNAYYARLENSVVFPAGVLQAPLFSKNYPNLMFVYKRSVNYGGMGSTIAHEITHGFDSIGRQYDKYGSTLPWWKPETLKIFNNKSQCFVNQYNQYQFNGEKLKGTQTLAENIADNGGIRIAYYAFKKWKEENEEELPLPEIGLNHDQLFFLSFAQFFCDNISAELKHYLNTVDTHALNKFRIIGSLSNFEDFASVYKCSNNSAMISTKQCKIW